MELLNDSDREQLTVMRGQMYRQSLEAGVAGFVGTSVAYHVFARTKYAKDNLKLMPKHAIATPLFAFAICMTVGSMVSARNNAHTVQYILHKYSKPQNLSPYQERVATFQAEGFRDDDNVDPVVRQAERFRQAQAEIEQSRSEWDDIIKAEQRGKV
ncbi:Uncharacterized protein SCF082_LOCUS4385 [Durusdinium trenchii]|uniref:Transmembrane protein n=1 Tax=Durusdinium trenchii TaxID=1381693 RepID=A0ABP0HZ52_9DINO